MVELVLVLELVPGNATTPAAWYTPVTCSHVVCPVCSLGSTADVGIDGIHLASVSSHVSGTHIGVSVGSGTGPSAAAAGLERQPSSISGQVSRSATANGGEEDCKYSSAGVPSRRARRYESQRTCDTEENVEDLPFYCQSEGGMMPSVIEHPGVFYVGTALQGGVVWGAGC